MTNKRTSAKKATGKLDEILTVPLSRLLYIMLAFFRAF